MEETIDTKRVKQQCEELIADEESFYAFGKKFSAVSAPSQTEEEEKLAEKIIPIILSMFLDDFNAVVGASLAHANAEKKEKITSTIRYAYKNCFDLSRPIHIKAFVGFCRKYFAHEKVKLRIYNCDDFLDNLCSGTLQSALSFLVEQAAQNFDEEKKEEKSKESRASKNARKSHEGMRKNKDIFYRAVWKFASDFYKKNGTDISRAELACTIFDKCELARTVELRGRKPDSTEGFKKCRIGQIDRALRYHNAPKKRSG